MCIYIHISTIILIIIIIINYYYIILYILSILCMYIYIGIVGTGGNKEGQCA